jgi:WD40 repeat protein
VGWPERAWLWCRRAPLAAALLTALAVAMVGGTAGIWVQGIRAVAAEKRVKEESERVQRLLYDFLIVAADRALKAAEKTTSPADAGDRDFAEDSLDQCPEDLRNVEWRLLYRHLTASRQTWRVDRACLWSIARSEDGTRIAAANLRGPVLVFQVADGKQVAQLAGPARQVAFLPDGDHLLVRREVPSPGGPKLDDLRAGQPPGRVELWSIRQRKAVAELPSADYFLLSGDGKRVAMVNVTWPLYKWPLSWEKKEQVSSRIRVCDALSGELIASTGGIPGHVADVGFSPDHQRLYAIVRQIDVQPGLGMVSITREFSQSSRFQLQVWKLADARGSKLGKPESSKDGPEKTNAKAMVISPDGKQILIEAIVPVATGITPGRIIILDAATGETVKASGYDHDADSFGIPSFAVSPDGKRLAVVSGERVLVFDRASGKRLADLAGHLAIPKCVIFDRDSNGLFTAGGEDGRIKRWDVSQPLADRIVPPLELPAGSAWKGRGAAFSHDSRRMAVATADGRIGIFEVATGRPGMTLPPIASAVAQDKLRDVNRLRPLEEDSGDRTVPNLGFSAADPRRLMASEIRFSPDGKRLTAVSYDRLIGVWDISGERAALVDFIDALALDKDQDLGANPLLLSPDGKYLASQSRRYPYRRRDDYIDTDLRRDDCFRVWEIENRRLVLFHEKDAFHGAMAFSDRDRTFLLARALPNAKPSVLAWDLASGKLTEKAGVLRVVDSFDEVSPDGSRVLRTLDGVIEIKDRQTGRTMIKWGGRGDYLWTMSSPDGNYILACKPKGSELLDVSPIATVLFPSPP